MRTVCLLANLARGNLTGHRPSPAGLTGPDVEVLGGKLRTYLWLTNTPSEQPETRELFKTTF